MENKDKIIELLDDAGLFPINPSFFDVISMASDRRVKTEVKLKAHRKNMLGEIADLINALYTEPVSEEAMMTKAKEFLNGDTPDIQKGVKTMHWAAYRMAKFALYMQQRQVKQIEAQPRKVEEIESLLETYEKKWDNKKGKFLPLGTFQRDKVKGAAQAIHNLIYGDSPNKVKEPSMCPICGSDDTFSFQQGCHKCRSCDYRFTK